MNLIKPKKLTKGDTIAIIAPSGPVETEKLLKAKVYFENLGYKVKFGSNVFNKRGYLAGSDDERLEDFHNAFLDKSVNAIICARGGYGALRLVDRIDYNLIRNNPKIFCGFSDITVLNALILKNSGLITFSAPMAQSDFGVESVDAYTCESLFKSLNDGVFCLTSFENNFETSDDVRGVLFGGNLSTLASLCGRDFIPDEDFILFVEDLNEPVYKIDRYFTQLLGIDKFKRNLRAIMLGEFLDADPQELDLFLIDLAKMLNIPVVGKFPISHSITKATVPYGAVALLANGEITATNFIE